MTFGSNVAPPKIPLRPKPQPWRCLCPCLSIGCSHEGRKQPGYLVRCPVCHTPRPG